MYGIEGKEFSLTLVFHGISQHGAHPTGKAMCWDPFAQARHCSEARFTVKGLGKLLVGHGSSMLAITPKP